MKKLHYQCIIHLPPIGECTLIIPEYPDYNLSGINLDQLMATAKHEVPEFLYMMACSKRTLRLPKVSELKCEPPPGTLIYPVSIDVPNLDGESSNRDIRLYPHQLDMVDYIIKNHSHVKSRTHYVSWAIERLGKELLPDGIPNNEPDIT